MRHLLWALSVVLIGFFHPVQAETPKMARQLTIDDGLSQSTVHAIYQAHDGRVWFATGDGVSIFDGESFSYLYRSPSPEQGLQNNYIFSLDEDPSGHVWIGTLGGGVSIYSQSVDFLAGFRAPSETTQSALLNDVHDVAFHPDGTVWIATGGGVLALRAETAKAAVEAKTSTKGGPQIRALPEVVIPIASNRILVLNDGRLLIGTQAQGMLLTDAQGQNPVPIRSDTSKLTGDRIMDLFADDQNLIWIGTEDGGLNRLDPATLKVSQPIDLPDSDVESIRQGADGRLWFGTWSNGIYVHDPNTRETLNYRTHPGQSQRLSSNTVIALMAGRTGRMWVGTYDRGVSSLSQFPDPFETYFSDTLPGGTAGPMSSVIWSLEEGVDDDLWVGSKAGLNRFWRNNGVFERIDLGEGPQDIRAILRHKNRLLLAIRGRGLLSYDWHRKTVEPLLDPEGNTLLQDKFIRLLLRDRRGQIWVGTHSGVYLLDQALRPIRHFVKENGELPHSRTRSLYEGPAGNIWIGTSGGLTRYDPHTDTLQTFSGPDHFGDNDVRAVYCLPDGRLLVGTQAGISILSKDMQLLELIGRQEGLPNETIYSLLPDRQQGIWATTNNGLARFSPDQGVTAVYKSRDGLQGAEFNFNAHRVLKDGTLAVGGINGLSLFHPENLQSNHLPPEVSFVQLNEDESRVDPPLSGDLVAPAMLNLDITVAHYADPTANQLRWRLAPVDRHWHVADGTLHKLRRENLTPGQYTLYFQGISAEGVHTDEQALHFDIARPIHLRWYSLSLYALLMVAGILFIPWLRHRSLRQRTAELEAMVQEKTRELVAADEERSQFYARAAHEIRTPVSLIKAPLQSIEKTTQLSERNKGLFALVTRAVDRLVQLTDEMTEVAEHRRGVTSKQVSVDLSGVIEPILTLYHDSAILHDLTLTSDTTPLGAATLDLEALELITHNLLSNAVRHTPAGGSVEVRTVLNDQMFELTVRNQAELPQHIIDNLYGHSLTDTVPPRRGSEIIGAMVRRSGAEIQVQSSPANVTVRLPAHHAAPAPQRPLLPAEADDNSSARILVVEDDRELREYLSNALSSLGQIRTAATCTAARRALQNTPVQLVICDVMLPDGSGFDLIREMKEDPETSHIPAVFLTALSDDPSRQEGLSAWGDDYVTKPFNIDTLITKIRLRLRNSAAIRTHIRTQGGVPLTPEDPQTIAPADERLLAHIEQHLSNQLADPEFSIDDLAQLCAVSKRSLQRKITAFYGQSFSQLLSQRRVEQAAEMLRTGMSVKEVYQACGYKHPSSFARRFRQIWGVQPSEYKKHPTETPQQFAPK